jgi:hypothetical protein
MGIVSLLNPQGEANDRRVVPDGMAMQVFRRLEPLQTFGAHYTINRADGNLRSPLIRTHFNLSLRGAQRRGNLDEAEHTSTNRRCYSDEIANPASSTGSQ